VIVRPRSLRAILALYVVLVLIALIGIRVLDYTFTHRELRRQIDLRLASEASEIGDLGTRPAMIQGIAEAEGNHDTADLFYLLVDRTGWPVAGKLRLRTLPPPGYSDFGDEAQVAGVSHGRALARPAQNGDTLIVASDNDTIDSFDQLAFKAQLAGLIAGILIVIGGAVGIMLMISSRMRAMQRTVDAVIAGDLHSRVPLDGSSSEFDRQAAAFNRMLDRIDELMENIRHAAKDVAHELKSPLARLRARTASLARQFEREPAGPGFEDLLSQTDEAVAIFSSLLRLWEVEGGHRRERFANFDIGELAREVADTLVMVAEDAGQALTVDAGTGPMIRGDSMLLRQMLVNMVENAIRHTPSGTSIVLSVALLEGVSRVAVSVRDNGQGIPAIHHATVVQRFGRLEAANHVSGQGLGLTLIDAIARLHHGDLALTDAGPGLCVTVTLPIAGR
jgi:signal transduction histidine kinase